MSGEEIRIGTELQDAAADPNEVTEQFLGTRLRDAAVDPRPGDHLPPVWGAAGGPVSVQALSPRSGNPPYVNGAPWPSDEEQAQA